MQKKQRKGGDQMTEKANKTLQENKKMQRRRQRRLAKKGNKERHDKGRGCERENIRQKRREKDCQETEQVTKWTKVNECALARRPNALYKGTKLRLYLLVPAS